MGDNIQDLSPDKIATLLDLAEKIQKRQRNSKQARSGAVVKRNDWTKEQRKLHAAKNDLKSAQFVYEKTRIACERAQEAFEYAKRDLEVAEIGLKTAIQAAEAVGTTANTEE